MTVRLPRACNSDFHSSRLDLSSRVVSAWFCSGTSLCLCLVSRRVALRSVLDHLHAIAGKSQIESVQGQMNGFKVRYTFVVHFVRIYMRMPNSAHCDVGCGFLQALFSCHKDTANNLVQKTEEGGLQDLLCCWTNT